MDDSRTGESSSLRSPRIGAVLDRLHKEARGDWRRLLGVMPGVLFGLLRGRPFGE